jgi:nucleotide-binding universal stress UspA family protein
LACRIGVRAQGFSEFGNQRLTKVGSKGFTRHRLRQMIFGGATSHIMEHADLPVLMAH